MIAKYFLPLVGTLVCACQTTSPQGLGDGIEREIKLQLSGEDFTKLVTEGRSRPGYKVVDQRNYYFDASGSLHEAGLSLRIRNEGDTRHIISLKISGSSAKSHIGAYRRSEYQCLYRNNTLARQLITNERGLSELDVQNCDAIGGPSNHPLVVLDGILSSSGAGKLRDQSIGSLRIVARNQTERHVIPLVLRGNSLLMEIDKTVYPQRLVGYELEVEMPPSSLWVADEVFTMLAQRGISYRPSQFSKGELSLAIVRGDPLVKTAALDQE